MGSQACRWSDRTARCNAEGSGRPWHGVVVPEGGVPDVRELGPLRSCRGLQLESRQGGQQGVAERPGGRSRLAVLAAARAGRAQGDRSRFLATGWMGGQRFPALAVDGGSRARVGVGPWGGRSHGSLGTGGEVRPEQGQDEHRPREATGQPHAPSITKPVGQSFRRGTPPVDSVRLRPAAGGVVAERRAKRASGPESDLYAPVKALLEARGFEVKAELENCDLVARRGDEEPVVVELKRRLSLELLLQAVDRKRLTERVYLGVRHPEPRAAAELLARRYWGVLRLCRLLGLGLISVHFPRLRAAHAEVHLDPGPYRPRVDRVRRKRLLGEFAKRLGDPNLGGTGSRPRVTAYRQDALRCAVLLRDRGPLRAGAVKRETGVERAPRILQRDVYGWFQRVERGVYALDPVADQALTDFAGVVEALSSEAPRDPSPGDG